MRKDALWAHSRHFLNIRPVYALGQWFLENLPISFAYGIALGITQVAYRFSPKVTGSIFANVRHVLSVTRPELPTAQLDQEARALTHRVFMNRGRWFADQSLMASCRKFEGLIKYSFEGNWKAFADRRDGGKGVLLASAHLGNWHGGGVLLGRMGIPIRTVIYHNHAGELMDQRVARRGNIGHIYVDGDPFSTMEIVRSLRRGEVVAMLADRPWDSRSIEAPLFGRPSRFPVGPVRIARLAEVPIFPAFCLHERGLEFKAVMCDPIEVKGADRDEAERRAVAEFARVLERFLAPHLDVWFVFTRVWEGP